MADEMKQVPPAVEYQSPGVKGAERKTGLEEYHKVADTVTGLNLHLKDNVIQAIAVGAGAVLGAGVGLVIGVRSGDVMGPVLIGVVAGVVVGVFGSGIYIAIYRAVRHAKGKHN